METIGDYASRKDELEKEGLIFQGRIDDSRLTEAQLTGEVMREEVLMVLNASRLVQDTRLADGVSIRQAQVSSTLGSGVAGDNSLQTGTTRISAETLGSEDYNWTEHVALHEKEHERDVTGGVSLLDIERGLIGQDIAVDGATLLEYVEARTEWAAGQKSDIGAVTYEKERGSVSARLERIGVSRSEFIGAFRSRNLNRVTEIIVEAEDGLALAN